MKRNVELILNKILNLYGRQVIKAYELEHVLFKYQEIVAEIYTYLIETKFKELKKNSNEYRIELLTKLYGTNFIEALYIIYYLHKTGKIMGDVCEFGVANGATSALIANEIKKNGKNLYLFDSFSGLSRPTEKDVLVNDIFNLGSMEKYEGTMSYKPYEVLERLSNIQFPRKRTKIIKGYIEEVIKQKNLPKQVSFAYIDFDLYQPIKTTLQLLKVKLTKNGVIIVDDYGFFSSGVKTAVDEFLQENKNFKFIQYKKEEGNFCILGKQ